MGDFKLTFVNQKSIKGQIIIDSLADNPLDKGDLGNLDFPNECVYFFETKPHIFVCPWYTDIINFIMDHTYPKGETSQQRRWLHIIVAKYIILK